MSITETTSGGLITMLLKFSKGNRGTEIEMIRKSRPLSKTNLLQILMERRKTLIHKSTVLETHPLSLTLLKQHMRSLSWTTN
jgi:hypothetical protein